MGEAVRQCQSLVQHRCQPTSSKESIGRNQNGRKKWLNSMPKSTQRCPKEVITRNTTKRKRSPRKKSLKQRRRRKKNPLLKKKLLWRNPRRKILLQPCPKATG